MLYLWGSCFGALADAQLITNFLYASFSCCSTHFLPDAQHGAWRATAEHFCIKQRGIDVLASKMILQAEHQKK